MARERKGEGGGTDFLRRVFSLSLVLHTRADDARRRREGGGEGFPPTGGSDVLSCFNTDLKFRAARSRPGQAQAKGTEGRVTFLGPRTRPEGVGDSPRGGPGPGARRYRARRTRAAHSVGDGFAIRGVEVAPPHRQTQMRASWRVGIGKGLFYMSSRIRRQLRAQVRARGELVPRRKRGEGTNMHQNEPESAGPEM